MKADLDETIENLNEGLRVSENSEVFTESPVQKPEVPAPTQAEMENLFWPQQMRNKACIAGHGAHCWFDIEGIFNNVFSWFIKFLLFGLDFFPKLPFTFSCNKVFRQNHNSDDLDVGSETNLDRNDSTVQPFFRGKMFTTDPAVIQNVVCEVFATDRKNPFVSPFLGKFPYLFSSTSNNRRYSCSLL